MQIHHAFGLPEGRWKWWVVGAVAVINVIVFSVDFDGDVGNLVLATLAMCLFTLFLIWAGAVLCRAINWATSRPRAPWDDEP